MHRQLFHQCEHVTRLGADNIQLLSTCNVRPLFTILNRVRARKIRVRKFQTVVNNLKIIFFYFKSINTDEPVRINKGYCKNLLFKIGKPL